LIDKVEFSEEVARRLRQAAAFDKALSPRQRRRGDRPTLHPARTRRRHAAGHAPFCDASRRSGPLPQKSMPQRPIPHDHQAHGDGVCQGGINEVVVDNAAMVLAFMMTVVRHYLGGDRR
jgi:hypothetical protein